MISKRLTLGRLESSKEFKAGQKKTEKSENFEVEIETLKITVRDVNNEDRKKRKLKNNSRGVVITEIAKKSVLQGLVKVDDIILEIQKEEVGSNSLDDLIARIIKKGEKTLLLTIINNQNQRRYLGVKLN